MRRTDIKALTGALEHARSGGVEQELIEAGERRLRELPTLNLQTAMQGSAAAAVAAGRGGGGAGLARG